MAAADQPTSTSLALKSSNGTGSPRDSLSRQRGVRPQLHTNTELMNLMEHEDTSGFDWVHCCSAGRSLPDTLAFV
jgi:hypothetical protein